MEESGTTVFMDNYFLEAMEQRLEIVDLLVGTPTMFNGELEEPEKELDNMHYIW